MSTIPVLPAGFGSDDLSIILLDVLQRKSEDSDNQEASLVFKRAHHLLQCQGCVHVLCTGNKQKTNRKLSSENNNASQVSNSSEKSSNVAICENANDDVCIKKSQEKTECLKDLNELSTSNFNHKNSNQNLTNGSSGNKTDVGLLSKSNDKKRILDRNKNSNINVQKKIKLDTSNNVQKRKQLDSSIEKVKHRKNYPSQTLIGASFWTPPSKIDLLESSVLKRTTPTQKTSSKESGKTLMFHGRLVSRKDPPIDIPWESLSQLHNCHNDPRLVNHVTVSTIKDKNEPSGISCGGTKDGGTKDIVHVIECT